MPTYHNAIDYQCMYYIQLDADILIQHFKAHFTAKSFLQCEGTDSKEIFSPTIR